MFGHRHLTPEPVQPDLPITPMLDMSFQLMAFFMFTFRPTPSEGQFAISNRAGAKDPDPFQFNNDAPARFAVRAEAKNGAISHLTLRDLDSTEVPKDLDADLAGLKSSLKSAYDGAKGKPPKLTLEVDAGLSHANVVQLIDVAVAAGFTNIAPVPIK